MLVEVTKKRPVKVSMLVFLCRKGSESTYILLMLKHYINIIFCNVSVETKDDVLATCIWETLRKSYKTDTQSRNNTRILIGYMFLFFSPTLIFLLSPPNFLPCICLYNNWGVPQ